MSLPLIMVMFGHSNPNHTRDSPCWPPRKGRNKGGSKGWVELKVIWLVSRPSTCDKSMFSFMRSGIGGFCACMVVVLEGTVSHSQS